MKIEIKVPEVGESVQEALLAEWYRQDGDTVRKGEVLFIIETDKVTLEVSAEADGILKILLPQGTTVRVGAVVGTIDTESAGREVAGEPGKAHEKAEAPERKPVVPEEKAERTAPEKERPAAVKASQIPATSEAPASSAAPVPVISPSVRQLLDEKGLDASRITGTGPGGRLTRADVFNYLDEIPPAGATVQKPVPERETVSSRDAPRMKPQAPQREKMSFPAGESTVRKPMSPIRLKIAERLLEARQTTAMLTTFNEIDMSGLQAMRARFRDAFKQKYAVSLGLMSFFIKASVVALKEFPEVNAFIDGKDIVHHNYYHIGVAVGAERGLVVPVIRDADRLGFAELEAAIEDFVRKIRENLLEMADLEGGTFTITNGGVYGSLMSTPILNSPQSAILGMHKIEDRPVAVEGRVVIRPMMYVALSYDHRIIDGREAVSFLKRIKECIESPERIMVEI